MPKSRVGLFTLGTLLLMVAGSAFLIWAEAPINVVLIFVALVTLFAFLVLLTMSIDAINSREDIGGGFVSTMVVIFVIPAVAVGTVFTAGAVAASRELSDTTQDFLEELGEMPESESGPRPEYDSFAECISDPATQGLDCRDYLS